MDRYLAKAVVVSLCLGLGVADALAQRTIFVNHQATGAGDGTSWTDAFVFLQDGLAVAVAGDEVWVAEGTYRPDQGAGVVLHDRDRSFALVDGVGLYGGFSGSESNRDLANWKMHATILSGDLLENDNGMVAEYEPTRQDNSRQIVLASGQEHPAPMTLQGFVIEGGHSEFHGGGMTLDVRSPWVLRNLEFRRNWSEDGGALWVSSFERGMAIENVEFRENDADRGAGLFVRGGTRGSPIRLRSDTFVDNSAGIGGGVAAQGWLEVTSCQFVGNRAFQGGALSTMGAGHVWVLSSSFIGNEASGLGGAIVLDRGIDPDVPMTFNNSVFLGNRSGMRGGAIYGNFPDSRIDLVNSTIAGNEAVFGGGALWQSSRTSVLRIRNSIIWDNTSRTGPAQIGFNDGAPLQRGSVSHSIISDGLPSGFLNQGDTFFVNPLLADPSGADGMVGTIDDDVSLAPGSPGIDAGNAAFLPGDHADLDGDGNTLEPIPFDLAGNIRIFDGGSGDPRVDLGALEFGSHPVSTLRPARGDRPMLAAFPMPFGDQVTIVYHVAQRDPRPISVTITDALGRRMFTIASHPAGSKVSRLIDSSDWPAGLYVATITGRPVSLLIIKAH
jgi:polymorphic membrane protein